MRECGTGRHHADSMVALEARLSTRVTCVVEWGTMSTGVNVQGENHGDSVKSCEAGAACGNLCPLHTKHCQPFCGLHRHAVNLPLPPLNKKSNPAALQPPPSRPTAWQQQSLHYASTGL